VSTFPWRSLTPQTQQQIPLPVLFRNRSLFYLEINRIALPGMNLVEPARLERSQQIAVVLLVFGWHRRGRLIELRGVNRHIRFHRSQQYV
jgi:hypothetical protein